MGELFDARQSAAAERCVAAILQAGTTRLSVEDLRRAAGVSKRTFHRYFPVKAWAIRPYYASTTEVFMEMLSGMDAISVTACADVWARTVLVPDVERSLALFRLVRQDQEYWSAFLSAIEDGEGVLARWFDRGRTPAETGADHADSAATSIEANVTAIAIVGASRHALRAGADRTADPHKEFERYLRAFAPPLLAP